jgi:hypothetical protein
MPEISFDPKIKFYSRGPCHNCKADLWQRDSLAKYRYKLERWYCFYCGADEYPGGAVSYSAMGAEDPREARSPVLGIVRNRTESDQESRHA